MKLLDILNMKITVKGLIAEADERFPGWRGPEKEVWVTNFTTIWLEKFDNYIPVVGSYLDLPVADTLEKGAVKEVVKAVFDEVNKVAESPVLAPVGLPTPSPVPDVEIPVTEPATSP